MEVSLLFIQSLFERLINTCVFFKTDWMKDTKRVLPSKHLCEMSFDGVDDMTVEIYNLPRTHPCVRETAIVRLIQLESFTKLLSSPLVFSSMSGLNGGFYCHLLVFMKIHCTGHLNLYINIEMNPYNYYVNMVPSCLLLNSCC